MKNRALDNALEAGGRLGIFAVLDDQRHQLFIDIFLQSRAQRIDIDVAGLQNLCRVGIVEKRQQQMFQRRVFVMAVAGEFDRAMQGLLKMTRE